MKNRFFRLFLLIFFLLPVFFIVVHNQTYKDAFHWITSAYDFGGGVTGTDQPPPDSCGTPCYHLDPSNPANSCAGGQPTCDGQIGGTDGHFTQDPEGNYWWSPDTNDGNDIDDPPGGGGTGGMTPPPVIVPPVDPPPGTGSLRIYAIEASSEYFSDCTETALVKTCIDTPTAPGCTAIPGSKSYLLGTLMYVNGTMQETQVDASGASYTNMPSGAIYTATANPPTSSYSSYLTCHSSTTTPAWTQGSAEYLYPNDTITYIVAMVPTLPWFQIQGGGNSFGGSVYSYMPLFTDPTLLFDKSAAPASPGILSSTSGFDLSVSQGSNGDTNVSTAKWNTNNGFPSKDWYQFFMTRLSQSPILIYGSLGSKPTQPPGSQYTVYSTTDNADKNITISTPWTIANDEKLIIIVDGTLDIRAPITISGNGFIAFVVKDDILINSSVGTTWNSTSPVLEGMYIAGKTIQTGSSTVAGAERLVGKGMFAATGDIILQRNLLSVGHNADTSSELFIYNPSFLVTMPDILKDNSYIWQEVAP
jgi:hypothetical protein